MITAGETYRELTAAEITHDALLILNNRNVEAWRQTISAKKNRRGVVKNGVSDIIGYHRFNGIVHFIECKKLGDLLRPAQIEFMIGANKAGAVCMVATQERDKTVLVDFLTYYSNYKVK